MGRTQPNYSAQDLEKINVPVVIVQSERDEFIKREHTRNISLEPFPTPISPFSTA
jgi:esterase/lipase